MIVLVIHWSPATSLLQYYVINWAQLTDEGLDVVSNNTQLRMRCSAAVSCYQSCSIYSNAVGTGVAVF